MTMAGDLYREWMRRLQLFLAARPSGPTGTRRGAA
ncbi:MAG: hypothetical protein QOH04_675 [Sphingomonadales bacterium]|jgi:hypothetical protein|nr:hypothetical protein [Sphingomonadales bacterium]MEA3034916.1 hypothetical protein [Sphingomonadales bacterium]